MPDTVFVLDLVVRSALPTSSSPLARPSRRYASLLSLSLVSRALYHVVQPVLFTEVHISEGTHQLKALLRAFEGATARASYVQSLRFVSRHREADKWDLERTGRVVRLCENVKELVVAIPTTFGLSETFLASKSLYQLRSLTVATPLRPDAARPRFRLESLAILEPFSRALTLSFAPLMTSLLLPPPDVARRDSSSSDDPEAGRAPPCALTGLVHLSLSDSHAHPFPLERFVRSLVRVVAPTLASFLAPSHTHWHDYADTFSCDRPTPVHPTHRLVEGCHRLERVYVPNVGHRGVIRFLPEGVRELWIGPTPVEAIGPGRVVAFEGASGFERSKVAEVRALLSNCRVAKLELLVWIFVDDRQRDGDDGLGFGFDSSGEIIELKRDLEKRGTVVRFGWWKH
ncbi:hypothetical protein JCM10212_000307 [Sporobolomyces blumeae]